MFDFSGRVALITGSSRGIGYAAAHALGRKGATVILNGRDAAALEQAAQVLRGQGVDTHALPFDIADVGQATRAVDEVLDRLGRIDIFFSNAGIQHREPLLSFPLADFERVLFANLTSQWALGRHIATGMARQGYGRIIFTGSITALAGRKGITAYTAAKSALHGLVRQWAAELADDGITVNAIAPGYIKTELTRNLWNDAEFTAWLHDRVPQKKWGEPEDIAAALVFLASRESGFVTGQTLVVDGGMTACM
ncbi:SDR family oxidoreductase [Pollutimonas sp. H1-120]|uniref:SDR family NAD(P)-dependent oxidoreductase n=1 Tax=Pollutimonas sp. H1-120 TaxID=3148824 RepID=UPI003B52D76B